SENTSPTDETLPIPVVIVPGTIPESPPGTSVVSVAPRVSVGTTADSPMNAFLPPTVVVDDMDPELPKPNIEMRESSMLIAELPQSPVQHQIVTLASGILNVDFNFDPGQLWTQLDDLTHDLSDDAFQMRLVTGSAILVAGSLSLAFVAWTARTSYLLAIASSSLPAWARIDPIPVLSHRGILNKQKLSRQDVNDKSLVELVV
ncbi:MAG: hypothetical protein KDA60_13450, partial [Planctomycetales bacterium]|nr:hypothetical protein [Planctomycetales bacterium]